MELNVTISIEEKIGENMISKANSFKYCKTLCCDDYLTLVNELTSTLREYSLDQLQ